MWRIFCACILTSREAGTSPFFTEEAKVIYFFCHHFRVAAVSGAGWLCLPDLPLPESWQLAGRESGCEGQDSCEVSEVLFALCCPRHHFALLHPSKLHPPSANHSVQPRHNANEVFAHPTLYFGVERNFLHTFVNQSISFTGIEKVHSIPGSEHNTINET